MLARWDLEDELRAIEDLLQAERDGIVAGHRKHYGSAGVVKKKKK
jgi:hypothetical protein